MMMMGSGARLLFFFWTSAVVVASAFRAAAPLARRGPVVRPSVVRPSVSRPTPELTVAGDTLELLPKHVAISGASTLVAVLGGAHAAAALHPLTAAAAVAAGLAFADIFSGVFHWATDNYGSIDTPIFGEACAAFQGHHKAPWTITYRHTANNVHKIARAAAPLMLAASVFAPPAVGLFGVVALFGQVLAQEFHKWSHVPRTDQPLVVQWLQASGLALTTLEHGRHHASPYDGHYCILTGLWNPVLDKSNVFRRLEAQIYRLNGVEPNCWLDGDKGARVKELALRLSRRTVGV